MIKYRMACFGSDMWALGCIMYECLTGKSPFVCKNAFEVEDKILNAEFKFPVGFNKDAKDLISQLLRVSPIERLGAGPDGSHNDLEALKAHPFFKNRSFERCHKRRPQVDSLQGGFKSEKYIAKYEDIFSQSECDLNRQDTAASSVKSINMSLKNQRSSQFARQHNKSVKKKPGFFENMIDQVKKSFQE
jgi:serine/threonine protein kinase